MAAAENLVGGLALTATELAYCASVSRSTASDHLSKLVAARLLTITRNRRYSYRAPQYDFAQRSRRAFAVTAAYRRLKPAEMVATGDTAASSNTWSVCVE